MLSKDAAEENQSVETEGVRDKAECIMWQKNFFGGKWAGGYFNGRMLGFNGNFVKYKI